MQTAIENLYLNKYEGASVWITFLILMKAGV